MKKTLTIMVFVTMFSCLACFCQAGGEYTTQVVKLEIAQEYIHGIEVGLWNHDGDGMDKWEACGRLGAWIPADFLYQPFNLYFNVEYVQTSQDLAWKKTFQKFSGFKDFDIAVMGDNWALEYQHSDDGEVEEHIGKVTSRVPVNGIGNNFLFGSYDFGDTEMFSVGLAKMEDLAWGVSTYGDASFSKSLKQGEDDVEGICFNTFSFKKVGDFLGAGVWPCIGGFAEKPAKPWSGRWERGVFAGVDFFFGNYFSKVSFYVEADNIAGDKDTFLGGQVRLDWEWLWKKTWL